MVFMNKKIIRSILIVFFAVLVLLPVLYLTAGREKSVLTDEIRKQKGGTYIALSQGVIHYEFSGPENAPVVVLVHGGTIPMFNYNYQVPAIQEAGYRVLRYDQYGRGYSDRPNVTYDRNFFSDVLKELIDSLNIKEPVALLGHSFGGSNVIHFTSKYPEYVARLILFSPMINGVTKNTAFKIVRFPFVGSKIARFLILPLSVKRVENMFGNSLDSIKKYKSLFKEQMVYKGFERALFATMTSDAMRDYSNEYKAVGELNKDVLLIWGDCDNSISREMIDSIQKFIPSHKFKLVKNGTHALNFNMPDRFNGLVVDFLNEKREGSILKN